MSGAGYAGDMTPREAWALLESDPNALLVDVRTKPEWQFVGVPDLAPLGRQPAFVSWQVYPAMTVNPGFAAEVAAAGAERDRPVICICRSGARSRAAAIALTAAGFSRCYNLAGGFEGGHDGERHRGRTEGWKAAGLPWLQE